MFNISSLNTGKRSNVFAQTFFQTFAFVDSILSIYSVFHRVYSLLRTVHVRMISIPADRRSQLAGRVTGKRFRAVFTGAQLGIPVVVAAVVRLGTGNPMILGPDTLSS